MFRFNGENNNICIFFYINIIVFSSIIYFLSYLRFLLVSENIVILFAEYPDEINPEIIVKAIFADKINVIFCYFTKLFLSYLINFRVN